MGEAFKRALFEKIEDEYDIAVADAAYKRYLDNPRTYTHDEVLRMFGDEERVALSNTPKMGEAVERMERSKDDDPQSDIQTPRWGGESVFVRSRFDRR